MADQDICDFCGIDSECSGIPDKELNIKRFQFGIEPERFMCRLCANTLAGSRHQYPKHYDDSATIKVMVQLQWQSYAMMKQLLDTTAQNHSDGLSSQGQS